MNENWINNLLQAEPFPHPVQTLECRETHISWVILTGEFAYKIKKPLDLGFLNYKTLADRKFFCEEELRLNRRFAPDLYLAVVPITGSPEHPRVDGDGDAFEYAVKMRQFSEQDLLDNVAVRGELDDKLALRLADQVAAFHKTLEPCFPQEGAGTPDSFAFLMRQNLEQIRAYPLKQSDADILGDVDRWAEQQYGTCNEFMRLRVEQGFIKECHGDLHLGNIALVDNEIVFFDGIEFSADIRTMDSIAEIAFMVMDLHARSLADVAETVLQRYIEDSNDTDGLKLLAQYCCYYSIVRAKVRLMSVAPDTEDLYGTDAYREFAAYLKLAKQFAGD